MENHTPEAVREWIASYKYKIELHAHSSPVSPCSEFPPAELLRILHEERYDGVVITNHFYEKNKCMEAEDPVGVYLDDYYRCREAGEAYGMKVYLGAEYRFRENSNDYLVFGADEKMLRETYNRLDMTLADFYREYHSEKTLIIQAHPFRNGMIVQPGEVLDGIEAFNMHPNHNGRVAVAARHARTEELPIITVGTDLHHPGHQGVSALRARSLPENEEELVGLLRSRDYLFEIGGCPLLPYDIF